MKAMWMAFGAIVVIAVVAGFALDRIGFSSSEQFSSSSTRPPAPATEPQR